jgi:hypothetical protein
MADYDRWMAFFRNAEVDLLVLMSEIPRTQGRQQGKSYG